jgi:PAS domain S-box-containing protein
MPRKARAPTAAWRPAAPAAPQPVSPHAEPGVDAAQVDDFYEGWQRYFDLYSFAPVAYIRLDSHGVVDEINQAGCHMLGAVHSAILRRPLIAFMVPRSRTDFLEHMRRCRTCDLIVESELSLQSSAGRVVPVRAFSKRSTSTIKTAYWTVLIDLTEQHRVDDARETAERERARAEHERQLGLASNEATHRFLNMLSHELRTPLTPALFAASRLLEHDMPDPARRLGELIKRNIQSEAKLIDDLLDVSRIERGRLDLSLTGVDIHAIIREAVEMCRPLIGKKPLALRSRLDAERHHVRGDSGRLRQVVSNLLINAIKYTDGGSVEVETANDVAGGIEVSVRDTGIGLDSPALNSLFKSFEAQRGQSSRGGLGLGLAICRGVIDAHGGRIWATSEGTGRGSTFEMDLPTIEPSSGPREQQETVRPGSRPIEFTDGMRILIVEDDDDTAAILQELLGRDGHSMDVVHTLKEAQRKARKPWDVVISDLGLPDGSGFDVARYFGRANPRPRLIALSGYGSHADMSATTAAGFERHLVKPIDLDQLRQALRA